MVVLLGVVGVLPGSQIALLPVLVLALVVAAMGVSVWLSALDVQYRDIRYAVPFLIQVWFFATPVVYSAAQVSEPWRTLLALNPLLSVIEAFRWVLLGAAPPSPQAMLVSGVVIAVLLGTGLLYFRRMERSFADVI